MHDRPGVPGLAGQTLGVLTQANARDAQLA